ncbi:hypothetical protein L6452_39314 [Arctium lappa]|uniref:Uncharacterized protein n=1 Tax=Arctium lappa TaxID=4217 RepID=A0ACB8XRZ7_ARCLA|nr:hypothetical protein L6452_39314 [Arctium lappa]
MSLILRSSVLLGRLLMLVVLLVWIISCRSGDAHLIASECANGLVQSAKKENLKIGWKHSILIQVLACSLLLEFLST